MHTCSLNKPDMLSRIANKLVAEHIYLINYRMGTVHAEEIHANSVYTRLRSAY